MAGKQLKDTTKSEWHASKHDTGSDASNSKWTKHGLNV